MLVPEPMRWPCMTRIAMLDLRKGQAEDAETPDEEGT